MGSLRIIIGIIAISLVCGLALAQSIEYMEINKGSFTENDELEVVANISNPLDEIIYFQYAIVHSNEEGLSITNRIEINATTETINVSETITEDLRNGNYSFIVSLTNEVQINVYDSVTLDFRVEGLPEEFGIELYACEDENCTEKSRIFILNDDVYLNYTSKIDNLSIEATLTYPDKAIIEIDIPYAMDAEQIGTYTLDVTASKEGYKNASESIYFAVIEKHANITDASECNADGTCDPQENYQNCPQDCASGQLDGICDLVEDEICDPDCNETRDEDCRIDYGVPMDEGWNLVSFPLERLKGAISVFLPVFLLLGILIHKLYT